MYSTKKFAKIRILKSNGEQREVTVENLSSYKSRSTLSFNYNSHPNYQGPRPGNNGLHPYLFLGFLPAKLVKKKISKDIVLRGKTLPSRTVMPILTVTSHFTLTQEIKHHSPQDGQTGL